jgi:hypothetical protein
MIRLFNHTRHQDGPIKAVLSFAARAIGVKEEVCVKVTRSRHASPEAYADLVFPYRGFMKNVKNRKGRNGDLLGKLPGYAILSLPNSLVYEDWLDTAEWFMHCALHEMAHIRQYREGSYGRLRQREMEPSGRRRKRHSARPCEIDAENQEYDVIQDRRKNARRQSLTIALAAALESTEKGSGK